MSEKQFHRVRNWMTRAYFGGAIAGMLIGTFQGGTMFAVGIAFGGAFASALLVGVLAWVSSR
jgi:hypothetical protein